METSDTGAPAAAAKLTVDLGSVADNLTCSICGGFLRNAATLKECFHTFCRVCILRYLIQRKSSCPKCHIALEGLVLDNIVADPKMQNLVDVLFPFYSECEQKMSGRLLAWAAGEPLPPALAMYAPDSVVGCRVEAINKATTSKAMELLKASTSVVMLHMMPDPQCALATRVPKLKCPHLMISGEIPVGMLAQFLLNQLEFEAPPNYQLKLALGHQELPDYVSVEYVCRSMRVLVGGAARPVCFTYRFAGGAGVSGSRYVFNKS